MKKLLALLLALAMVLGMVACSSSDGSDDSSSDSKVIKIGVFEPTTGENGGGGQLEVDGIKYANQVKPTVTIDGEEYQVELVISDNKSDKSEAANAASYLVNQGVSIVLGSYGSGVSIAAGSVFADAEIPAIGCSCTNPQVTLDNDYYFRVCFLDSFQAKVLAYYAIQQGYDKAAVLTQIGDDYSIGLGTFFEGYFADFGGEIVSSQSFPANNSDYSALLQNIKTSGAQCVFAPSSITAGPVILQQAQSLGLDVVFMGPDTWDNADMVDTAEGGSAGCAEGYICSTFFDDSGDDVADFVNGYKEAFEVDNVNVVTALGYDAYMTAITAIEAAGSTKGSDIRDALVNVSITGVTGPIAFDENGDVSKDSAVLKTVQDGKLVYAETVTVTDVG
jgi:branched-chain amino acid transport system substrate-binding protein